MKVVVYCAHTDDMILGAGGYLTQLAEEKHVTAVFATDGLLHFPKLTNTRGWAEEACEVLGIKDIKWLNISNMRFDTFALIDINKRFEGLNLYPDLLLTNSGGQLNKDHRIIFESALVVTRPIGGKKINLLSFESTVWKMGGFMPQYFIDISKTIEKKIEAMKKFRTEMRPYPHPRSPEAIMAQAQYWGMYSGMRLAEPFEVIRWYG